MLGDKSQNVRDPYNVGNDYEPLLECPAYGGGNSPIPPQHDEIGVLVFPSLGSSCGRASISGEKALSHNVHVSKG